MVLEGLSCVSQCVPSVTTVRVLLLQCLDEDGTRQTRLREIERKVAGDRKSATFRCHRPATKTHGHVTLHQPPAPLVHKKLLNCNTMALRTCSVSVSSLCECVSFMCVLVSLWPCYMVWWPDSSRRKVISLSTNKERQPAVRVFSWSLSVSLSWLLTHM